MSQDPDNTNKKPKYRKPASEKAMDYLAIRDHSEKELRQKLLKKEYSKEEVDQAIDYCWKHNFLLPPEELAERVTLRLHEKGKGINYIRGYLSRKGIPFGGNNDDFEVEKALDLIHKKLGFSPPFEFEEKVKVSRFLKNRGFDGHNINRVLNEQ